MIKKTTLFSVLIPLSLFSLSARAQTPLDQVRDLAPGIVFSIPEPAVTVAAPAVLTRELVQKEQWLFDYQEADPFRYVKPPCLTSPALTPGRTFSPAVSDARRVRAIEDLLARLAVCKPMPYDNDGNVHSKPHEGLPAKPSGYYLEYTLIVPNRPTGSKPEPVVIGGVTYMTGPVQSTRGPERLMIGNHNEVYYTPDHYTTFIHLDIVR